MADDPSQSKEERDREAKAAVTQKIIDNPDMIAIVQDTGMSSQQKRKENKEAKEKREKEGGSSDS